MPLYTEMQALLCLWTAPRFLVVRDRMVRCKQLFDDATLLWRDSRPQWQIRITHPIKVGFSFSHVPSLSALLFLQVCVR